MDLSVVIPAYNEQDNLKPLIDEITKALADFTYEIVIIDDGSNDETPKILATLSQQMAQLSVLRHQKSVGQSYALITGVNHAKAPTIATLDGDGQNDPADIVKLYRRYQQGDVGLIMGHRINRRDSVVKKFSSSVANAMRSKILADNTPDTGCGIKVFGRADFMALPSFHHMHRYLPALFQREGKNVVSIPVNHRERWAGKSKYGIHNRLWSGIVDLLMVRWLIRQKRHPILEQNME